MSMNRIEPIKVIVVRMLCIIMVVSRTIDTFVSYYLHRAAVQRRWAHFFTIATRQSKDNKNQFYFFKKIFWKNVSMSQLISSWDTAMSRQHQTICLSPLSHQQNICIHATCCMVTSNRWQTSLTNNEAMNRDCDYHILKYSDPMIVCIILNSNGQS